MKFYLLFISFMVLQTIKAQKKQNYLQLEYNLSYRISKSDTTDIRNEIFYLFIEGGTSKFVAKNRYLSDSIISKVKSLSILGRLPKSKFNYTIIKELSASNLIFKNKLGIYKYKYSESLSKLTWKLLPKIDSVRGQKCYLAKTTFRGRTYTACYSKDITYQTGPYKFHGLPGLILKIKDNQNDYIFEAIQLKTYNESKIQKEDVYIEISAKDYAKFVQKLKNKSSILFRSGKLKFPKSALDKIDERQKNKNKYENNPIELTME